MKKWIPWTLLPYLSAFALPQNPVVTFESADVSTIGAEMIVTADDGAVINWDSFSIDNGERVQFIQPSAASAVLNRVVGSECSWIQGQLESNGQVILINHNGFLFDGTSIVNTGSLVASAFDVFDGSFHDMKQLIFHGSSNGSITLAGPMNIGGDFYVFGDSISQEGPLSITEGDAGFFALGRLHLTPSGDYPIFERTACQGLEFIVHSEFSLDDDRQLFSQSGGLTFLSGVSSSATVATQNSLFATGSVLYLADSALLTVSRATGGGDVYFGGVENGNPQILARSSIVATGLTGTIDVSGGANGNGGKAILWSTRGTEFYGVLLSNGGEIGGDGGLIEVSSLGRLIIEGTASAAAPAGAAGTFLIDPSDVIINNVSNTNIGPFLPSPPPPLPGQNYSFTASPATILNTTLQNLLTVAGGSNVLINTANGVGGTGNITVQNNVSWATNRSLNLTANGSITIRAVVENTGLPGAGGDLILNAGTDVILDTSVASVLAGTRNGTLTVNAGNNITLTGSSAASRSATLGTTAAAVTSTVFNITAGNNLVMTGGTGFANSFALIGTSSTMAHSSTMTFSIGRDLIMTGGGTSGAFTAIGTTSTAMNSGNLGFTIGRDLIMTGGSAATTYAAIGASGASNSNRAINMAIGRNLSMTGGGLTLAFACIGSAVNAPNQGTISMTVGQDGVMQGGTGLGGYALIGGFGQSNRQVDLTVARDLSMTGGIGGAAAGAPFAAIGSFNNAGIGNSQGDLNVNVGRNLNITAGTATGVVLSPVAGIMRAGEGTAINSFTPNTNFNVNVGNNLTMTGGTTVASTGCTAYIGFGGFRQQGAAAGTVNVGNININVGHNLEMINSAGKGAAHIVGGTQRQCQGNVVINVGENFYMHNIPSAAPSGFLGNSIGGSGTFNQSLWRLNFYVTVGKSLTIDARSAGFNSFHCFNGVGNYIDQNIVQFHIGGDFTAIGGALNQIDTATIWLHPNATNEIWVGGNWRAYNGRNASAGVEPNVLFALQNIGKPDWRAGGNIIVAGATFGLFGQDDMLFTTTQPIFIEADYGFSPGQLWLPKTALVNGVNIFTGTPLGAISGNQSTVAPFHSGGDGLGGFSVDTNMYTFSVVALPTTVNGPSWSTATPLPPAPPFSPGFFFKSYVAGTMAAADLTILSADLFDNASPADFAIGTMLQTTALESVLGNILVEGFRDVNITDFQSLLAPLGNITVDVTRDINGTNTVTTAGLTIDLTAGRNINLTSGSLMQAGVDLFQTAEDDINLIDSFALALNDIVSIAGNNSLLQNSSATAGNNIDWVVDNDFPSRPLIGPFGITMDDASSFSVGTGYIRVYTARQSQNSISPLAQFISNGTPFTFLPGTLFVDTDQEQWCTYYPDGTLGIPFRIFYKDCLQQVTQQATVVVDQFLVDLHPYNEFPGWQERFTIGGVEDLNVPAWTLPFEIRRRHLNVINHPKSYTHLNMMLD